MQIPTAELFPISKKALQMLLYIIDKSGGEVSGKTKLIKVLFLIETEEKVKFDFPIKQGLYGPYRDNEYLYARANGLIEETQELTLDYRCINIRLTERGKEQLSALPSLFKKNEIQKAEKVIEKYQGYSSTKIKEHVYQKYLDKYAQKEIAEFETIVSTVVQIANAKLDHIYGESDKKSIHKQVKLVGYLEHIKKILNNMGEEGVDKTERSVILNAIKELVENLKSKNFSIDDNPEAEEICDFIDNYAEVHHIAKSISDMDLSDLTEDERKCIVEAMEKL